MASPENQHCANCIYQHTSTKMRIAVLQSSLVLLCNLLEFRGTLWLCVCSCECDTARWCTVGVVKADEGMYTCSVHNQFGTVTASAFITVTGIGL